jgi:hypothetical protein
MRRIGSGLVPWAVLVALGIGCFARLIAEPSALIADGARPSIDFANRGDARPLGNDATFVFLPRHLYVAKVLAEFGHLPAWDCTGFGGRPIIGNPQSGVFYPPVWIAWFFCYPATLGWLTVGHLLWGGLGLYVLARSQGLSRWPATVAAGVFQASPYLLAQTFEGHYPHVWAACWFPWAFWAHAQQREGQVRGLLAMPVILAMAYLTGHPQEWFLLVIALTAWVCADVFGLVIKSKQGPLAALVTVVLWVSVLGVGLSLVAIELVPARELLPWVQRSSQQEAISVAPRNYQLHLVNGLQILSGEALGGPADYLGDDNFWESVLSFGLVSLVLIVAAGVSSSERSQVWGWIILVVLSVWFAAGRQLGLCNLLYWALPGLSWFRVPARSLFLSSLGAAMLAGFGIETLRGRLSELALWRRFAFRLSKVAGIVLVLLLLGRQVGLLGLAGTTAMSPSEIRALQGGPEWAGSAALVPPRYVQDVWRACQAADRILHDPPFWIAVAALGTVVVTGCLGNSHTGRFWTADLVGLLALGELAWHGFALIQVAPAELFFRPDPVSECLISTNPRWCIGDPLRIRARDSFFLDLQAVRYGIEKTNINDVFQLQQAASLYETLYPVATRAQEPIETPMSLAVEVFRRQVRQGVFDRMGVSALVSDRIEPDPPWPVLSQGQAGERDYVIQQNLAVLPRAYVVPRAEVIEDEPAMILSRFRSSDPRSAVLMSHDPLAGLQADRRQPFIPVTWLSHDPDRPRLEVSTEAPGLLVIADTWLPGWSALVDGQPAPIYRGNHSQRVIPLEQSGRHTIILRYSPPGLALGGFITAMSGLVWVMVGALVLVKIRRTGHDKSGWFSRYLQAFSGSYKSLWSRCDCGSRDGSIV